MAKLSQKEKALEYLQGLMDRTDSDRIGSLSSSLFPQVAHRTFWAAVNELERNGVLRHYDMGIYLIMPRTRKCNVLVKAHVLFQNGKWRLEEFSIKVPVDLLGIAEKKMALEEARNRFGFGINLDVYDIFVKV